MPSLPLALYTEKSNKGAWSVPSWLPARAQVGAAIWPHAGTRLKASLEISRTRVASPRGGHSNTCRRTVRDRGQDAVKRSTRVWNAGQRVNDQFQMVKTTLHITGSVNGQHHFPDVIDSYCLFLSPFLQLQIITPSPQHYEHDEACSNLVIIVIIIAIMGGAGQAKALGLGYARARIVESQPHFKIRVSCETNRELEYVYH